MVISKQDQEDAHRVSFRFLEVSFRLNSLESLFVKEGLREFGTKGADPGRCDDGAAECCREFESVRRGDSSTAIDRSNTTYWPIEIEGFRPYDITQ